MVQNREQPVGKKLHFPFDCIESFALPQLDLLSVGAISIILYLKMI